tara:strand:+ start:4298 stop:4405 length:108 start_codon:yes stop_codon:yes gene_type:complete
MNKEEGKGTPKWFSTTISGYKKKKKKKKEYFFCKT